MRVPRVRTTTGLCLALAAVATAAAAQGATGELTIEPRPTLQLTAFRDDPLGLVSGATTLGDGTLVVADEGNLQLYLFAADGTPRAAFGRKGGGPGEFRSLVWLGRCGLTTVAVFDPLQQRVVHMKGDGTLGATVPVRVVTGLPAAGQRTTPYALACAPTGGQVAMGWPDVTSSKVGPYRSQVNIAVSRAGSVFTAIGTFPGPERYRWPTTDGPRQFGKQTLIAAGNTRVYVAPADSFHIEVFSFDGVRLGALTRSAPVKPLTPDDVELWIQRNLQRLGSRVNEAAVRASLAGDVLPKVLPHYQRLLTDGDRLWVEEGHPPTATTRVWWGFDERGVPLGRITVPASFELYEVSGSLALGKWTDEDGAESVRRYRLTRNPRGT